MKAFLLATALIAAPAIAQSTMPADPAPAPTTTSTDTTTTTTTTVDPATGSTTTDSMTTTDAAAPAAPPMAQSMPMPGATGGVVFQNTTQVAPPPAPRTDYPVCSRTVTDGCRQRVDPK